MDMPRSLAGRRLSTPPAGVDIDAIVHASAVVQRRDRAGVSLSRGR